MATSEYLETDQIMMTVGELKKKLEQFDDNLPVFTSYRDDFIPVNRSLVRQVSHWHCGTSFECIQIDGDL